MDSLLIAPQTRRHIEALLADAPQAIALIGAVGVGKKTVANAMAVQLADAASITFIEPDNKNTIGIETIRSLYKRTQNRQEGRQVIIVDHAEAMGIEAQNAFLKLLEEPRSGVTFILTAPTSDALLPTVSSRVQTVIINRFSQSELRSFATPLMTHMQAQEQTQLLFVADGRPGVLVRLLDEPESFEHSKQLMTHAKDMLAASPYIRLARIATVAKTREDAIMLLEAMARMLHSQLLHSPNEQLLGFTDGIQECLIRLAQNGNPRAQLTYLFSHF